MKRICIDHIFIVYDGYILNCIIKYVQTAWEYNPPSSTVLIPTIWYIYIYIYSFSIYSRYYYISFNTLATRDLWRNTCYHLVLISPFESSKLILYRHFESTSSFIRFYRLLNYKWPVPHIRNVWHTPIYDENHIHTYNIGKTGKSYLHNLQL